MTGSGTRARPPAVFLGWVGVLVLTVAIGVVGQTGIGPSAGGSGGEVAAPSVGVAAKRPPTRAPARPTRTRPPISVRRSS